MNWHIGQEIVCIKTHSQGIVKKDSIYTIVGLKKGCCMTEIDVGIRSVFEMNECTICGVIENSNGIWWIGEEIFSPLEYDQNAIEELLENTLVKTN